jgi:glycine/D-amino acid oxidase-like deaminating enzyme
MAKVAVIGGGIFGGSASVSLARAGHDVTIFEKNKSMLQGSTATSTSRLHLGFHYPRDRPTATQSLFGSRDFLDRYPGSVRNNFPNYYGLLKENSKTSLEDFTDFIRDLHLPGTRIDLPVELAKLGLASDQLAGLWRTREGSIDVDHLRRVLVRQCVDSGVRTSLDNAVERITTKNGLWRVWHSQGVEDFDVIVRATYGGDQIECDYGIALTPKVFELTLNLELAGLRNQFGITLIDGDFLTVLPKGFSVNSLVYAPGPSVIRRVEGFRVDQDFLEPSRKEIQNAEEAILERMRKWLPGFPRTVVGRLVGLRTLLPGSRITDARESSVLETDRNFFDIFSGKIDHSVTLANEICKRMERPCYSVRDK